MDNKIFQLFTESAMEGLGIADLEGNIVYANMSLVRMLKEKNSSDMMGNNVTEYYSSSIGAEIVQKILPKILAEGKWAGNVEMLDSQGNIILTYHSLFLLRDENNKPEYFANIITDLTTKNEIDRKLREKDIKFENVIQSVPMGVHMYHLDERDNLVFVNANEAANKILGVDNSIFIGKTIEDAFPALVDTEVPKRYKDAAKNGAPWRTENIIYDEGDIKGAFEVYAFQTEPGYMAAFFLDITEKKIAEDRLIKSQDRFRTLLEVIPDGIFILNHDGIFNDYIPARSFNTFLSQENFIGKHISEVLPPEIAKQTDTALADIVDTKEPQLFEYSLDIDGSVSYYEARLFVMNESEIMGVVRNITDVKRTQRIIIQTEKMMSVGGLAAGMAHEINNPLSSIIQGVQNIERRLNPINQKNREIASKYNLNLDALIEFMNGRNIDDFLKGIKDAGIRAAEIVQNMLNFSRLSEVSFSQENFNDLLDETLALASHDYDLKKKYDFKKIKIEKKYQEDIPLVKCVKSEIQQVILNLLKNGAEIMNEKSVCNDLNSDDYNPVFSIRTYKKSDKVCIEIVDNGPGMDEETQKRVFEPFFTTKPVGKGTGLGLSVSYFIITQNHKGNMWVESEDGKGTKFVIELPIV